jgi:hypothetical protein
LSEFQWVKKDFTKEGKKIGKAEGLKDRRLENKKVGD